MKKHLLLLLLFPTAFIQAQTVHEKKEQPQSSSSIQKPYVVRDPTVIAQELVGRLMTTAEVTTWNVIDKDVVTVLVKNINNRVCMVQLKRNSVPGEEQWLVQEYRCDQDKNSHIVKNTKSSNPRLP